MRSTLALLALLVVLPSAPGSAPARARHRASASRACGVAADGDAAKGTDVEYAGIVPGRGLSAEDFAGDGLVVVADPSLALITGDPVGVLTRACHNWEIPGTMIKFHVTTVGPGNVVHAMGMKQAARATIGRPGWGRSGSLDMSLDVPFTRGDDSLVAVVTHELGHWLGFDHSFLGSTVMFPVLTDHINWVDPDQVAKAVARYGVGPNALAEIRGSITRNGQPLSGARVNLLGTNDRTAFATFAGADGVYHVPVFAGSYRLVVDPNDGPAVKGNFLGTYPGGPLDFVTVETPGTIVVSAGESRSVDVDVPTDGDVGFKITTDEPTVCSPGAGAQGVTIYYVGARPDEIAAVEPLTADLHVTNVTDTGGQLDVFVDVDRTALPGPRAFRLRKTNGAVAIVTGLVGVVAQYWLDAPTYTLQADPAAPLGIAWTDNLPRDEAERSEVSVSVDGGVSWDVVGSVDAATMESLSWTPDPSLATSALRVRVRALDSTGDELAIDESAFNLGLGRPARGAPAGTPDAGPPTVTVLAPNGGETLAAGERTRIRWEADDDVGLTAQVVEVSEDGGRRWATIGEAAATERGLDWTPSPHATDALLVRVSVRDPAGHVATDTSDGAAHVQPRPSLTSALVKVKGAALVLKVKGTGFRSSAVVLVNGQPVSVPVTVGAAGTALKVRGDAATLHLSPAGESNTLVLIVDGLASAELEFST